MTDIQITTALTSPDRTAARAYGARAADAALAPLQIERRALGP